MHMLEVPMIPLNQNNKEYEVGRILPDEFGEDTDVLHMKLEDFYQEWDENAEYTHTYLLKCRKQQVESYRRKMCIFFRLSATN